MSLAESSQTADPQKHALCPGVGCQPAVDNGHANLCVDVHELYHSLCCVISLLLAAADMTWKDLKDRKRSDCYQTLQFQSMDSRRSAQAEAENRVGRTRGF